MKKLPKYKGKDSTYHKTLAGMTAIEEAGEILMQISPLLRVASPAALKIIAKQIQKGFFEEVDIDDVFRSVKKSSRKKR